jgi:hypothetical protein
MRYTVCVLAFACIALTACAGRSTEQPAAQQGPAGLTVGQTRVVGSLGAGDGVTCPTSLGRLDEMTKAKSSHDDEAYQEAVEDAEILRRGQHVRIVEIDDTQHVELILAGGPDAGTKCWTAARAGLFR